MQKEKGNCPLKRERKINIYQFETKIKGNKYCWEKERKEMYIAKGKDSRRKEERETERERGIKRIDIVSG